MEQQHSDDRRTISEVLVESPEDGRRRVTLLETGVDGGILGNHYHMSESEFFALIKGSATLLTANHETPEDITETRLNTGDSIEIPTGVTHTFVFDGEAVMMSSMDGAFDPTDMHGQKLA